MRLTKFMISMFLHVFSLPALGAKLNLNAMYSNNREKDHLNSRSQETLLNSIQLQLDSNLNIESNRVYLSDIANCFGYSKFCDELLNIEIMQSPKPGAQLKIDISLIKKILDEEYPKNQINLTGPNIIQLHAVEISPEKDKILSELRRQWGNYQTGNMRFSIQDLRISGIPKLRHKDYNFEFENLNSELGSLLSQPRKSLIKTRIKAIDLNAHSSEITLWDAYITVRCEIRAFVSTKFVNKGSVITEADFERVWKPCQENFVYDYEQLKSLAIRIGLERGQILRRSDLIRVPDVLRGEKITAFIQNGVVKLNSAAVALDTGVVGDNIRVQLEATQRKTNARIVAKDQVEVSVP